MKLYFVSLFFLARFYFIFFLLLFLLFVCVIFIQSRLQCRRLLGTESYFFSFFSVHFFLAFLYLFGNIYRRHSSVIVCSSFKYFRFYFGPSILWETMLQKERFRYFYSQQIFISSLFRKGKQKKREVVFSCLFLVCCFFSFYLMH